MTIISRLMIKYFVKISVQQMIQLMINLELFLIETRRCTNEYLNQFTYIFIII